MAKPRPAEQNIDSDIIDLIDIVEIEDLDAPVQKAGEVDDLEDQIADLLHPMDDQDDDILDLDGLLAETEARDTVKTGPAPDLGSLPMPDLDEVDAMLSDGLAEDEPEELDFAAELDSILGEGPVSASEAKSLAANENEEIAIDDLDDLLSSISPPERPSPPKAPPQAAQEDIDVDDLDSLLDSIMNPEAAPEAKNSPSAPAESEALEFEEVFAENLTNLSEQPIDMEEDPETIFVEDAEAEAIADSAALSSIRSLQEQMSALQSQMASLAGAQNPVEHPAMDELLSRLDKIQTEVQEMAESNALGLAAAEARISALETELASLAAATSSENGLVDLDTRLTSLEASLAEKSDNALPEALEDRLAALEAKIAEAGATEADPAELDAKFSDLENRLNQEMEARLAALPAPDTGLAESLAERLAGLEANAAAGLPELPDLSDLPALKDRLSALEAAAASNLEERIALLEASASSGLEERLAALEARSSADLESRLSALENAASAQDATNLAELEERLMTLEQMAAPDVENRLLVLEEKIVAAPAADTSTMDLEQRLSGLENRLRAMEANMEQSAAAAAARVIREELSNLLSDQD